MICVSLLACFGSVWFMLDFFLGFDFFFINGKGYTFHSCPTIFGTWKLGNFDFFLDQWTGPYCIGLMKRMTIRKRYICHGRLSSGDRAE